MSSMLTRRAAVAAGIASIGALGSCGRWSDSRPKPRSGYGDPSIVLPKSRALGHDAMNALDEAFGSLQWESETEGSCIAVEHGSLVYAGSWRTARRWTRGKLDLETTRAALASACEKHGLPAPKLPELSTGGWLTTRSESGGLRLTFGHKLYSEILVDAFVTGSCAGANDGGW